MPLHLVIILVLIGILHLVGLMPDRTEFSARTTVVFLWATRIACILLLLLYILSNFSLGLRGYWTTKILVWVTYFVVAICYLFAARNIITRFERIVYRILFSLPIVIICLLAIPFLGGAVVLHIHSKLIGDTSLILVDTPDLRLDQNGIRFLGPSPQVNLYLKNGFLEYGPQILPIEFEHDMFTIRLKEGGTKEVIISFIPTKENHRVDTTTNFAIGLQ